MTTCVKEHLRDPFLYKRPLREQRLLEQIGSGKLFGYVQRDIDVSEELRNMFANFPPIFNNTDVSRHDIALLMKDEALSLKRRTYMSTTENVDFKLFPLKRNTHYSSDPIIIRLGASMQKTLSLRGICSS